MKDFARELLICQKTQREGFGAVYERIMLGRLLKQLVTRYKIHSVLEYRCPITKGYDNLALLDRCNVTIADKNHLTRQSLWVFEKRPRFVALRNLKEKFDLVWNFALVQQNPELIDKMKKYSQKYILVFTPNFLNIGSPIHYCLHFLSKSRCRHAERGQIKLRIPWGLKNLFMKKGLKILESGFVDLPPWPDTAFSLREVKKILGFKPKRNQSWFPREPKKILEKIEKLSFLEKNSLLFIFKLFFSHHLFVFGGSK